MARWLVPLALTLLVAAAGCGGGGERRVGYLRELPPAEDRLDLIAYPGYAESGSNDPDVDWVTPFERTTGCNVRVRVARSATEMIDLVVRGGYDGLSASGDIAHVLTGGREVAPLNTDLVPGYAHVYPALKGARWYTIRGQPYGVPHGRGPTLLLWRQDLVRPAPRSWRVLWDVDTRYAGRFSVLDSPMTIAEAALELKATSPELGIRDVYELDGRQFRAAVRLAARQAPLVGVYSLDETKELADFTGGNVVVGTARSRIARLLEADQVPVATVLPDEGATGRADVWMLLSRARHPGCMYRWLDWILSPWANAAAAQHLGEAPATPLACGFTRDPGYCDRVHAGDEEYWRRVAYWKTPQHDCGDARGEACVDWFEWLEAWGLVRGA